MGAWAKVRAWASVKESASAKAWASVKESASVKAWASAEVWVLAWV